MDNILPENEYQEIEGRAYLNPQVSLDESNTFIDNLRTAQGQQNQEIFSDTQRLGTDVSSDLGGLTGAGSYFTSRYQTPQTNSAVANLRAAAQASALNQILQDEQAIWKKRYQDAYRNYQKKAYNRAYGRGSSGGSSSGSGGSDENTSTWNGEIEDIVTDGTNGYTAVSRLSLDDNDMAEGGAFIVEPASGNIIGEGFSGNNPRYVKNADGTYTKVGTTQQNKASSGLPSWGVIQNNAPLANATRSNL